MEILVVAATQKEIQPLLDAGTVTRAPSGLLQVQFSPAISFSVLITGVGIAATVFSLTQALHQQKPDLIVQAGIAGSYSRDLVLGDVVLVTRDRFAGLGVEDGDHFADVYQIGLADPFQPPFHDGWLTCSSNHNQLLAGLRQVDAITVDTVTGTEQTRAMRFALYQPVTESMEGAACFYVAAHMQVPALQVRSISNYVEKRQTANWNIPLAVTQLNDRLIDFIQSVLTCN